MRVMAFLILGFIGSALLLLLTSALAFSPRLQALLLAWYYQYHSQPSQLERERQAVLKAVARQEKIERKQLIYLAKQVAASCRDVMTGVGYCHQYRNPGQKRRKFQQVAFSHAIIVGRESIMLRLGRVPMFQTRYELFFEKETGKGPWMARELELALQREVRILEIEGAGLFIHVGLKHGVSGIPRFFWWRDPQGNDTSAMDGNPLDNNNGAMQDPNHNPLTRLQINVGLTANRRMVRVSLRDLPNLIVAGVPGSGKSVFLNQMICTWLERNTPNTLDLRLVDLKGGVEFDYYAPLLGGMVREFVEEQEGVAPMMHGVMDEIHRRQVMFKGRCKNLGGWNQRYWPKLPYLVVIVDELSVMMYDRACRAAVEDMLKLVVALGRATGVHLVLCTQVVRVEVLPGVILGNIPAKICFNTAHHRDSILVVGHGGAAGLSPEGRAIWQSGAQELQVQAPMILDEQIRQVVESVADLRPARELPVTIEELMLYAFTNHDGLMSREALFDGFKTRLSKRQLEQMLQNCEYRDNQEGPTFDLSGTGAHYRIQPGAGSRPRIVERVRDNGQHPVEPFFVL